MNTIHRFVPAAALALWLGTSFTQAGSIARLVYDGITGATVGTLTNATIFPDTPSFREQLDDHSPTAAGTLVSGFQSKENSGANFGAWVRGYLEAPDSGAFTFFVASDDASELWISTDHQPANKKRVAFESASGAALFSDLRLSERKSAPLTLARGQKYYIEVLHKQGSGSSYLQVGWQRPDGVREIVPALHLAQHPVDAYLGRLDPNLAPLFNPDGFNGGNLSAAATVDEGRDLILELDVIAAQPTTIEWRRNGTVIPGENLSFLLLRKVSASWNGDSITAVVSNAQGRITSAAAKLSVKADTVAPSIVSVDHRGNPNQLTVTFSEPVDISRAGDPARYALAAASGTVLPIAGAKVLTDQKSVQLSGAFGFQPGASYTLTTRDIVDQAAAPNLQQPNPSVTPFSFTGDFIGPVAFGANGLLQDQSVLENRSARFEAKPSGAKPWSYQWTRNGTPIPGATNSVLEVTTTTATAGGYAVVASNEFSQATSSVAQLKVVPDLVAPRLVKVRGLAGANTITITLDEVVSAASANNAANYTVDGLAVSKAVLGSDGRTVTLTTAAQTRGQIYIVAINGLRDIAQASNLLTATASFSSEVDYTGQVLGDGAVRYFRFDEPAGSAAVATVVAKADAPASGAAATPSAGATLGVPGLVPSAPENTAIQLSAAASQFIAVPNGNDLNATGPFAKKSFEVWFRANSAPSPDSTGLDATAGIWEQGAGTRNIALYLWRDPAKPNPNEAELVFHAFNNAADGPGSPFGLTTFPAAFVQTTIQVGKVYHAVGVFDGDASGTQGSLVLYVNGVEVGRVGGIGQIYAHTGDVQIGRGNGIIHTGENGNLGFFDGVLDDISAYNTNLTAARVLAHYQAGVGSAGGTDSPFEISRAESRGNPGQILVSFNKPVSAASAASPSAFIVKDASGSVLPIQSAELLTGELTVRLSGAFGLQSSSKYSVTAAGVTSQGGQGLSTGVASFTFAGSGAAAVAPASSLGNRDLVEDRAVQFQVVAAGVGPFVYQWFRDGVALAGQNSPTLSFTALTSNAGVYTVRVSNEFSDVTSAPARLTVTPDTFPPKLISAVSIAGTVNQVRLKFDEPLDATSAKALANYVIPGLSITSATLGADNSSVVLKTSQQQHGQVYALTVSGLKDRSKTPNAFEATVPLVSNVSYADEVLADVPVRYWRLDETNGVAAVSLAGVKDTANLNGTYVNAPTLGVGPLFPNDPASHAVLLKAASSQRITIPNGSDLNATAGPWAKRTVQFWFKASSVPAPGTVGLAATAGLWEEGAASRNIAIYLWRDPSKQSADQAELVFNALNNVAADGAGSPFGPPATTGVFVQTTVRAEQTYHVVAVFDGDSAGLNGKLVLYLNGVEAGRAPGVGQIYNHTGDIQIGRGNGLTHDNLSGDLGFFDGVLDEVSVFNSALSASRVAQLYQSSQLTPVLPAAAPRLSGIRTDGASITVTWDGGGVLQRGDAVTGPFVNLPTAASPYSEPLGAAQRFFRLAR